MVRASGVLGAPTRSLKGGRREAAVDSGNGRVIQPHSHHYATLCYLVCARGFVLMGLGCAVEEHRFVEIHRWGLALVGSSILKLLRLLRLVGLGAEMWVLVLA